MNPLTPLPIATTARHTHFHHLDLDVRAALFLHPPQPFGYGDERDRLAMALGATLYVPATRPDLAATILSRYREGVVSMVIDLEDAVADHDLEHGIRCTVAALNELVSTPAADMLLFVRVRTPQGIPRLTSRIGAGVDALTGFVVPKFTSLIAPAALTAIHAASAATGRHLYLMPVLESPVLAQRETRDAELQILSALLAEYRKHVLAVRIGATDMCGLFGIRRDPDLTIYDVRVVADVLASIVSYLGRSDGTGFIITGPVWEYFADHERMFRPTLRETPFKEHDAVRFRKHLVSTDLDGLLREIALDRANGITGKTVIHPSHVAPVHALSAVTHEEFHDATDILNGDSGGVLASGYGNKMNELKPHRAWAERVALRASVFGVTRPGVTFVDLLTALVRR